MSPDADADADGAAERRLDELLRVLRADPPRPEPGTALAVVTRARWQRSLRAVAHVAGQLVSAVGDAVALLIGRGGRAGR